MPGVETAAVSFYAGPDRNVFANSPCKIVWKFPIFTIYWKDQPELTQM